MQGSGRVESSLPGAGSNLATALAFDREPLAAPAPRAEGEGQGSLFRDLPTGAKILPIPTLSPMRPASPLDRESVRRNAARSAGRTPRHAHGVQHALDLREMPGRIQQRPEEVLFRDAMVAEPKQRAAAAALDGGLVLAGAAIFAVAAFWVGVDFGIVGNLLLPAAMAAVVSVLYRGLWCVANCDTPGMRLAGLRLVDFDGREPRRESRVVRQFAGLLSLASAGVGLAWALVDEESLTWHDHISKTFPTSA